MANKFRFVYKYIINEKKKIQKTLYGILQLQKYLAQFGKRYNYKIQLIQLEDIQAYKYQIVSFLFLEDITKKTKPLMNK